MGPLCRLAAVLCPLLAANVWAAPVTALLTTPHGEGVTSLRLQPADAAAPAEPVATFTHLPGAPVRGTLLPSGRGVLVVTDLERRRDVSFSGVLLRVEPGKKAQRLADRVVHSTRALVTGQGRIFVQRGRAGASAPASGERHPAQRVDALTIDEVLLSGAPPRTVLTVTGQTAFLAGSVGAELLVYRVLGDDADVCAVNVDTGEVRVLSRVLPYARDFSVDGSRRALVYTNRHPQSAHLFRVERLPLAGGAPEPLGAEAPSAALLPFAWPDGSVSYNPGGREGLHLLGAADARGGPRAPLGEGTDTVRAVDAEGAWAALLHAPPGGGAAKRPWLLERATGRALPLAIPAGVRVEVAGMTAEATP